MQPAWSAGKCEDQVALRVGSTTNPSTEYQTFSKLITKQSLTNRWNLIFRSISQLKMSSRLNILRALKAVYCRRLKHHLWILYNTFGRPCRILSLTKSWNIVKTWKGVQYRKANLERDYRNSSKGRLSSAERFKLEKIPTGYSSYTVLNQRKLFPTENNTTKWKPNKKECVLLIVQSERADDAIPEIDCCHAVIVNCGSGDHEITPATTKRTYVGFKKLYNSKLSTAKYQGKIAKLCVVRWRRFRQRIITR